MMGRRLEQESALGPAHPKRYAALSQDDAFLGTLNEGIAITPRLLGVEERMRHTRPPLFCRTDSERVAAYRPRGHAVVSFPVSLNQTAPGEGGQAG